MSDSRESHSTGILRRPAELLLSYLSLLAILLYPVGLSTLWVQQVMKDYIGGPVASLYAASLVPIPVVAGKAIVSVLILLMIALGSATLLLIVPMLRYIAQHANEFDVPSVRWLHYTRFLFATGSFLNLVTLPQEFGFVYLDSTVDWFLYVGCGLLGGYLIVKAVPVTESSLVFVGPAVAGIAAMLGAFCLSAIKPYPSYCGVRVGRARRD